MTDDYVPLTDEQVGAIRDDLQWRVPDVLRRILADREHYKRRAETAERCQRCGECKPAVLCTRAALRHSEVKNDHA